VSSTRADSHSDRPSAASPPLFTTLKDDVRHVVGEMKRRGIRHAVTGTFTTLETFYLTDADRTRLSELRPGPRWLRRMGWLLKGLLMKLTPARRVLLVAALVVWLMGTMRISVGNAALEARPAPIATAILVIVLMLELRDKLVARDELEAGRAVQLALMPAHKPNIPGWHVWLYTRPANDVGGDLIDHLRIDERSHFVALGDVAGKALPAALLSVKLQATLRALAPRFDDLGELGGAVNHILQRDGLPSRFASLVYLLVSEDSGCVRLLNAGHMPPLLVGHGQVRTLERGSMVLGMMPDVTFGEQRVELSSGDSLIVYSDGITEAMNDAGDFFGDERLLAVVRQSAGLPPETIGARVLDAVATFATDAVPSDDVSLIVLERA
jgi:hypothetical protein